MGDICKFEIRGSLSQVELLEVVHRCERSFNNDIEIHPRPQGFGIVVEAIGAVSGVVAVIIAAISLCYQIRQHGKTNTWTLARLKEEMSTECARQGLPAVQLASISNFDALLNQTEEPCRLKAATPDGRELEIIVFHDGSMFTLHVM